MCNIIKSFGRRLGMKQSKGNDQAWEQFLKSCGIQGPLRDGLRQYYGV